jgi:peptidoglycan/LPS O-acetylase OafA/YrhL
LQAISLLIVLYVSKMTNNRFIVLDSFRGICAICVVIYHLHWVGSLAEIDFFRGSGIFVEFFFVLSGFVLAHGYGFRESLNFKDFVRSRFFRLYPLHLFMLLIFVSLEFGKWVVMEWFGFGFNNQPYSNDYSLDEFVPNLLLIHAWTPLTNPLSFNTPSWSISIEFYTYLLLFLTIVFARKFSTLIWAIIPSAIFMLDYYEMDLLVAPVMRGLSCFFGGAFCYVIFKNNRHRLSQVNVSLSSFIEVGLVAAVVAFVQSDMPYRSLIAPPLFCATVLWFALEKGLLSFWLKGGVFQLLGKLSYSIYMTHAAIIYLVTSLMLVLQKLTGLEIAPMIDGVRFFTSGYAAVNSIIVLMILAMVVFCSYWTYRLVELKGLQISKSFAGYKVVRSG